MCILLIPSTGHEILSSNLAASSGTLPLFTGGGDSTALAGIQDICAIPVSG